MEFQCLRLVNVLSRVCPRKTCTSAHLGAQAVDSLFENLGLDSYPQEAGVGFARFPAHTTHTMPVFTAVLHHMDARAWPQYSTFQQP